MKQIMLACLLMMAAQTSAAEVSKCIPTQFDETVTLAYINDGDIRVLHHLLGVGNRYMFKHSFLKIVYY